MVCMACFCTHSLNSYCFLHIVLSFSERSIWTCIRGASPSWGELWNTSFIISEWRTFTSRKSLSFAWLIPYIFRGLAVLLHFTVLCHFSKVICYYSLNASSELPLWWVRGSVQTSFMSLYGNFRLPFMKCEQGTSADEQGAGAWFLIQ